MTTTVVLDILSQWLVAAAFITMGVINLKKMRRFSVTLLIAGMIFIVIPAVFHIRLFQSLNEDGIYLRIFPIPFNIFDPFVMMFEMGIPQVLLGVVFGIMGIINLKTKENRKLGVQFLVASMLLIFVFAQFMVTFNRSM